MERTGIMKNRIELLEKVLLKTRNGLRWKPTRGGDYRADTRVMKMKIEYLYPIMSDEVTSGADMVRITVGKAVMMFHAGTEGEILAGEILAAGNDGWREHRESCEGRYREALRKLDELR